MGDKPYELDIHLEAFDPKLISEELRKIANKIDKNIWVSAYDPCFTMKYPGSGEVNEDKNENK